MASSRSAVIAMLFGSILATQAELPVRTDEDTELHWAFLAETETRTSTSPRFAEADEAQGEGVLEAFGAQYLPNAYAHYQEVRATAKEREQLLKENFPDGRSSDPAGGAIYDKVCKAATKSVSEMFRRHDELCHYLLLHRMGVVSDRELADLDAARISILLPSEYGPPPTCNLTAPVLASAEIDFASKYLPETHAAFLRLSNAFSEGAKAFEEWRQTALLVDAARSFPLFNGLYSRLYGIQEEMNGIVKMVKEQKLLHAVGETTAKTLAEKDNEMGLAVQQFEKGLAVGPCVLNWVRENIEFLQQAIWPDFISKAMVKIPGASFLMGKYEVTQAQWAMLMGNNPSEFEGLGNPVENVSWDDCQVFLEKLNALPAVKKSGLTFRLPTKEEWDYACRAGATGACCKLADGTEITWKTIEEVAWFDGNSEERTHPVGLKKPNAFGLYDMLGNVWEWTDTAEFGTQRCYLGGGGNTYAGGCKSSLDGSSPSEGPDHRGHFLGFRLCSDETEAERDLRMASVRAQIVADMVDIPGKNYKMGKTEVTQAQWELVMGANPSRFKNLNNPVENVSWYDCQVFLKKLNALPAVKKSGLTFRLPTKEEWDYACRAGAKGHYCKLADGTEITEETIGQVAWFWKNSEEKTHPVGRKKPNAFGLYDMLGNVWEWTDTADGGDRSKLGGSWDYFSYVDSSSPSRRDDGIGFRLCSDRQVSEEERKAVAEKEVSELLSILGLVQIPGRNYMMGKTEVTQAQWEAVMDENPSRFEGEDHPVEWVSWDDCQEFLKKLNALPAVKESGLTFRLPTKEEWEYACRAGAKGDYCRLADGTEITDSTLGQVAWFMERSDEQLHHPVGQKRPNAFGLYDMHGNVYEWTSSGTGSSLAGCGGAWYSVPLQCKSSYWAEAQHDTRGNSLGFRLCADTLKQP